MKTLPEWNLYNFEVDIAGILIGRFLKEGGYHIRPALTSALTNDSRDAIEKAVSGLLAPNKRAMVVYGCGSFHHYTYGLCKFADRFSEEYGYIHLDHHSDDSGWDGSNGLHCGSFTGQIARYCHTHDGKKKLSNLLFIGSTLYIGSIPYGGGVHAFSEGRLRTKKGIKDLESALSDMPEDIYITMDLDVMARKEIVTAYDQGSMHKEQLLDLLRMFKESKRIIGADALGFTFYSPGLDKFAVYSVPKIAKVSLGAMERKSLRLYKSIVDVILEKERLFKHQ